MPMTAMSVLPASPNTTDPIFSFYPIVALLGYVSEMIICVKLSVYVLVVVSHFVLSHFSKDGRE